MLFLTVPPKNDTGEISPVASKGSVVFKYVHFRGKLFLVVDLTLQQCLWSEGKERDAHGL